MTVATEGRGVVATKGRDRMVAQEGRGRMVAPKGRDVIAPERRGAAAAEARA